MNNTEYVALNQYLSEYPQDMTYDEIIDALTSENPNDEGIVPTEFFEDWYRPALAEEIESLKWSIEKHITGKQKENTQEMTNSEKQILLNQIKLLEKDNKKLIEILKDVKILLIENDLMFSEFDRIEKVLEKESTQ